MNDERFVNGERERTLNGERKIVNGERTVSERWTHAERTMSVRWSDAKTGK